MDAKNISCSAEDLKISKLMPRGTNRITLPLAPHSAFITWQRTRHRYHRISSCKVFWSHQNGCDVSKDEQENTSHKRSRVLYSTIPTFSVFNEASQTIPTLLSKWWFLMVAIWTAVVGPRLKLDKKTQHAGCCWFADMWVIHCYHLRHPHGGIVRAPLFAGVSCPFIP